MAIRFVCEFCGRVLNVQDDLAGRRIRCPDCREVIVVADSSDEEPSPTRPQRTQPRPTNPRAAEPRVAKPSKTAPIHDSVDWSASSNLAPPTAIGILTDRNTSASHPGRITINPFLHWYCFPLWPTVATVLAVGFTIPAVTGHMMSIVGAIVFWLLLAIYWSQIADKFKCGCLCPAVVISQKEGLVAVYTDLTTGDGEYPAVRVIKQPLRRMSGPLPKNGDRLVAVSMYMQGHSTAHWETFFPTLINCGTASKSTIQQAMRNMDQSEWRPLLKAIETFKPNKEGLLKLWE